jgi:hypothetical protein
MISKQFSIVLKLFLFCFQLAHISCYCSSTYNATTTNLREILIGRCYYFLNVLHKQTCFIDASKYDCEQIWNSFSSAVIGKNPCDVKMDDYNTFLNLTYHEIPVDKSLFWSGTFSYKSECKFKSFLRKTIIQIKTEIIIHLRYSSACILVFGRYVHRLLAKRVEFLLITIT